MARRNPDHELGLEESVYGLQKGSRFRVDTSGPQVSEGKSKSGLGFGDLEKGASSEDIGCGGG